MTDDLQAELWEEPKTETVYVKIRGTRTVTMEPPYVDQVYKRGIIFAFSKELLEWMMSDVAEGEEFVVKRLHKYELYPNEDKIVT